MIYIFLSIFFQILSFISLYLLSKSQVLIFEIFFNPLYLLILSAFFLRSIAYLKAIEQNKLLTVYYSHSLVPLIIFFINFIFFNFNYNFINFIGAILITTGIVLLWKN